MYMQRRWQHNECVGARRRALGVREIKLRKSCTVVTLGLQEVSV